MATLDDAIASALRLPEVSEGTTFGNRAWLVRDKRFMWQRPFSKADIKRFGDLEPPQGDILAARVADLGDKEAALQAHPMVLFSIPHLDGFAAVLVHLDVADQALIDEVVEDAWLSQAPRALADEFIAQR